MHNSILKMAGSPQRLINLLPQTAHSATICGETGCGKSFHLGSARRPLPGVLSSWSCARLNGIIRPISSAPGSGRTPRSTFLTPVSASTITCERFTMYLWVNRRCISLMTALTAFTKKKGYAVYARFLGLPCRAISRRSTTLS